MDGVVRIPSAFSMTFGVLPSITATHEFVVPRSIPMTFPMVLISFFLRQVGWALTAHQSKPPTIKCSRYCEGGLGLQGPGRNLSPRKPCPLKDSVGSGLGLRAGRRPDAAAGGAARRALS